MFSNLTGWHALIIVGILVLIFGATKLPVVARGVAQSIKVFQTEIKTGVDRPERRANAEPATSHVDPLP